ncbi:reductive dehalogenase [Dehalogenimonas formicexedens]|uniref:Reductive dehalogenase n=1 Tax=Dehalogenimonas formicexedens TaxID=1839801 RepID=A0A1P8F8Z0_9CHLR|nr:reductive dehalogenase [Dehalogenimonas formicexedens]APV44918.1 reductive dehalogenase [Dehalogenimonas formicexedens]
MNLFYSTMSRRQFMKGLGLAGVGTGVASLAPQFHDLDELASNSSSAQRSWWVKEREHYNPVNEIDWNLFKQYDKTKNPFYSRPQSVTDKVNARDLEIQKEAFSKKVPGDSLRDYGFSQGSSFIGPQAPWDGPTASLPAAAGGVAWQDSAENNTRMMRAAIHAYGGVLTGALEVNDKTLRIFPKDMFVFSNIDKAQQDKSTFQVPNKCKYILTFTVKQNYIQSTYGLRAADEYPGGYGTKMALGNQAIGHAYSGNAQVGYAAMRMVKSMGYQTIYNGSYLSTNVGLGVFSGIGEQGRPAYVCTPDYGLMIRYTNYFLTDMPLAPTPPIDAGILNFCKTCIRCGDGCPSQSISKEADTTWDAAGTWNRPGFKGWYINWQTCIDFGSPGACMNCLVMCPFNHPAEGVIHPIVRAVAATTPMFDRFFGQADRAFGYSRPRSESEMQDWWDRDLKNCEFDTTLGAGKSAW